MSEIIRVSPEATRSKVLKDEAILVCAYEDPAKYSALRLEGAISFGEFRERAPFLDKGREIIFYCA
ncbi:MAG: ArsR family transcriptional regulator [Deltaproteobacteria bacterium]|nr:ArsR family transcriptional regulator [Deltaproteobacteria bacterium]